MRGVHFTRAFRPPGERAPRVPNFALTLLATLIAHGTNLGLAMMAHSVEDGITADMLQEMSQWCFREDTLKTANAILVNFHHRLPLSAVWGDGTVSSSDGQRFGLQASSLLGSLYPRYFGYYDPALTVYTHVADQHSVFHTQVIACSLREAIYVLDGLLANDTILRPKEHFVDQHGYTDQLFGLCHLLGYSLMPRLTVSKQPSTSWTGRSPRAARRGAPWHRGPGPDSRAVGPTGPGSRLAPEPDGARPCRVDSLSQ